MSRTLSFRRGASLALATGALAAASFVVSTSPADAALSNSSPPRITGQAKVGNTLKATRGVWRGQYELPVSTQYTYQWFADGVAIPEAKGTTLALTADELGEEITVAVTAKKAPQAPITATSAPTKPVAKGNIKTATMHIEGINKVGHTQAVTPGHWKPNDVTFDIVWFADGIPVAFGYFYTPTAAQIGTHTSVYVVGSKPGYNDANRFLSRFGTVKP
ncbi:hypothetical protein [Aeromicrobium terrae]|uniref:Uncharacterized protein n=1 Tax=Aeromicrobium terrae TaxID=2498846 RepID=A0A5C8NNM0_9ACTN|nr:hypothetical protein [Aeromicrobium terrae]TXL62063.1 hypothetical protein FHP06_04960 [Aeromicrobium terrae]